MRTETVTAPSRQAAARLCPWAAKIVRVEGGYKCFESLADYITWCNQR